MDFASFIGIVSGLSLVVCAIILGGDLRSFVNIAGLMIVLGGTIAASLLTFKFKNIVEAFAAAYKVFADEDDDPNEMVAMMVQLCDQIRRKGILHLAKIETENKFLKKACTLIADGSKNEVIRQALRTEIDSLKLRHFIVQDVFKKMAGYSPAFGMLGTLIGLVQMLSSMHNAASIGPALAVALLTTFYGSLISTMICLPIAGKLKSKTISQVICLEILFEGAILLTTDNNPLIVYEQLSSHISSKARKPYALININKKERKERKEKKE